MKRKLVIAIGNKARQGKDTIAEYIKSKLVDKKVEILHWADDLKKEVSNRADKKPLITKIQVDGKSVYKIIHLIKDGVELYNYFDEKDVPTLNKLFEERGISEYFGDNGVKDSPMLQFWGTNYRRNLDNNYWVNRTLAAIADSSADVILIPDTRFLNEYHAVTQNSDFDGIYVNVIRLNKDGSRYIDTSRDPNHPSEIELDSVLSSFTVSAQSNDKENLLNEVDNLLQLLHLI